MAIKTSGALSLNEIHAEVGGASGTTVSLNDTDLRGLTPASGYSINSTSGTQISIGDFYGASNAPSLVGYTTTTMSTIFDPTTGARLWDTTAGPQPGAISGIQNGDLCLLSVLYGQSTVNSIANVPSSSNTYNNLYSRGSAASYTYNGIMAWWIYDSTKSSYKVSSNLGSSSYRGYGLNGILVVFRNVTTLQGYGYASKVYTTADTYGSRRGDPPSVTGSGNSKLWLSILWSIDGTGSQGYNNSGYSLVNGDQSSGYTFITSKRMNAGQFSRSQAISYKIATSTTEDPGLWNPTTDYYTLGHTIGFS